jgi:hypothetical protein
MTITIVLTPYGITDALRSLLPIMEPVVLALAAACGAGVLVQIGLGVGLRLAQRALRT